MKIGVLEIIVATAPKHLSVNNIFYYLVAKQYAGIMPQAVSAWCRRMGHDVHYATYWGQADPMRLLPGDLDLIFISTYTHASPMAYAVARLFKRAGARTVVGGPHAKVFPQDCLRFFDLAVQQCDEELVRDIVDGVFEPGTVVSSEQPLTELPGVEERMPEISTAVFTKGRPYISTVVPMLASAGCPYTCDFCVDWNNPYILLPEEQLEADLLYLSTNYPGVKMAFQDPNFAVKFDSVLDIMEGLPSVGRNPYLMETSLSILKGPRLQRLKDTGCCYIAPGIESWTDNYSGKSAVGSANGQKKVDQVVEHFGLLHEYCQGFQANFLFGLDTDQGDEPVELTKQFLTRTPWVWPVFNIPTPYGGTPLHSMLLKEGRIMEEMPFALYYSPYLAVVLKNYGPVEYYEKLVELHTHASSWGLLRERLRSVPDFGIRVTITLRHFGYYHKLTNFKRILKELRGNKEFRAFHRGSNKQLPDFYRREYQQALGRYADLFTEEERKPVIVG